jgi:dUTPase
MNLIIIKFKNNIKIIYYIIYIMSFVNMSFIDDLYNELKNYSKNTSRNFAIMKISFGNNEIEKLYYDYITKNNKSVINNLHCDSGFDVFVPNDVIFNKEIEAKFIDMKIKVEMIYCDVTNDVLSPSAFYLYPRSSISKTDLMLANHVGIIDSGYRGNIIGAFRWFKNTSNVIDINPSVTESNTRGYNPDILPEPYYKITANTRLLQICHPTLCPIYVISVNENQLSITERGSGGFGSTG